MNMGPRKSPLRIWKFAVEVQVRKAFQKNQKDFATWIRQELVSLGPAFVKIGQFLSTRIDIFGKEVTDELAQLQDRIEPIPFEVIDKILKEELGEKYQEIEYINPTALATASIGQVHRGKLVNQQEIAIKVQKPNIAQEIQDDLKMLNDCNRFFMKLGSVEAKEMDMVLNQYQQFLSNELNYSKEIHQMNKFRSTMDSLPVYIPKPYKELSTNQVLTMEYVESLKITELEGMKKQSISPYDTANQLVEIFLTQIIKYGIVHCDPHPGNIGIRDDGTLVLYDFGNVVTLSSDFRKNVNNLVFAIYQKDIDEFVEILLKMNVLVLEDNFDMLELKSFFQYFFSYLETQDFNKLKKSILNRETFSASSIKIRVNQDFMSLFRVFSLIDGTCSYLNPSFNYIIALRPFTDDMFTDMRFIDSRIQKDIRKLTTYPQLLKSTDTNIARINRRVTTMMGNVVAMRSVILLLATLDNLEEPEKLLVILPALFYIFTKME